MILKIHQDIRRQVAQLFVVRASGYAYDSQRKYPDWELPNDVLKTLLKEGVGGVILYGGSVHEIKNRCNILRNCSKNPIFLSADVEEGVGQRFEGGSWLPPPMALGRLYIKDPEKSIAFAERYGRCIGRQARRCGLNWVLAPVCDVNTNSMNPVINMRSWGSNLKSVIQLTSAFNKGLHSQGILSCAKHFPGHGDTKVDSHLDLPILDHDLIRLEELELKPFQALIDQGVNSIMIAHILFSKIDSIYPSTFSKKIITKLLKERMGFQGIVVTDALIMKAITDRYGNAEAAIMAFEAGADLILMPQNPFEAIEAITESLINGRVPMNRLENAIERRTQEISKFSDYSLDSNLLNDNLDTQEFENSDDFNLLQNIIQSSIETTNFTKINPDVNAVNLIKYDGTLPSQYLSDSSPALVVPSRYGYQNVLCHPLGLKPWQDNENKPLALERVGKGPLLLQIFVRGNPFRGDLDTDFRWIKVVEQLQKEKLLKAVVVYGNPYFWEEVLKIVDSSIPAVYAPGQMPAAQKYVMELLFKTNEVELNSKNNVLKFTD